MRSVYVPFILCTLAPGAEYLALTLCKPEGGLPRSTPPPSPHPPTDPRHWTTAPLVQRRRRAERPTPLARSHVTHNADLERGCVCEDAAGCGDSYPTQFKKKKIQTPRTMMMVMAMKLLVPLMIM